MEIKEALTELRKEPKRKFNQSVDLIVNLKNFDVRKEALNTFIDVPHPTDKKVGAFLSKRSSLIDTITEDDFVKYKDAKDIKRLAKKYDSFIAAAPLMGKIATKFGRVFGPMNKMPSPQAGIVPKEDEAIVTAMIKKMKHVARVKNKEASIKLICGKEDMKDEDIEENIRTMVKNLEAKLPRGKDNVRGVLIKFTMTKSLKIMEDNYGNKG